MLAVLDLGIDLNVWPWIWLFIAVVFAVVELTLVGGSFIILPWAASAFVAAVLAFYDVAIEIQWTVFVIGGAGLFVLLFRWAQRFMTENTLEPGVGADRLVGLVGLVTTPIEPDDSDRLGRVTIDGEVWGAVCEAPVPAGTRVRVVSMKGTRVIVTPVRSDGKE